MNRLNTKYRPLKGRMKCMYFSLFFCGVSKRDGMLSLSFENKSLTMFLGMRGWASDVRVFGSAGVWRSCSRM